MPRSLLKPAGGYPARTCPGCNTTFQPNRHDQSICSKACREALNNFEKARAQQVYRALYHWRLSGGRMGKAPNGAGLGDISRLVQGWIEEDKRTGRALPALPFTNR